MASNAATQFLIRLTLIQTQQLTMHALTVSLAYQPVKELIASQKNGTTVP
jgi:hypothetical protein